MNDGIEIVWGETTPSHAHMYFHTTNSRSTGDAEQITSLTGTLIGPESLYAKTLPARYTLRPSEPGSGLLAELVVPDPCFWTPELPLLYQLDMQLQDATCATRKVTRLVGIRHWGVDRAALRLAGRRIVLRGLDVGPNGTTREQLALAHDMQLTLMVQQPDKACCEAASRVGVALIADLRGVRDWSMVSHELVRISRWPSVLLAVVDHPQVAADKLLTASLPIIHPLGSIDGEVASEIANWADGVLVEMGESHLVPDWLATLDKPVLAIRRENRELELATIRQACDRLQADLAPRFDLAGYFVGK